MDRPLDANQAQNERVRYGDYEVIKAVGKGKFAVVYRAQSLSTGLVVALKRINVDTIDDRAREKCLKECKLLSSLDHPNIIKYLDSFVSDHDLVIVVEWAGAGDLKRQLRKAQEKNITFDELKIWKYFKQVAAALQHMHERRIMHRDLKPANIFLHTDGSIKVGDFGLSRELSENTIQAHSKVGTPLYMSPEVLKGVGYDFKSDIWSLGCLLYELCMLKSPFKSEGLNLISLFHKIAAGDYQPISDNYSMELGDLVVAMLSNDPEQRPEMMYICEVANRLYSTTLLKHQQNQKAITGDERPVSSASTSADSDSPIPTTAIAADYDAHHNHAYDAGAAADDVVGQKVNTKKDNVDNNNEHSNVDTTHANNVKSMKADAKYSLRQTDSDIGNDENDTTPRTTSTRAGSINNNANTSPTIAVTRTSDAKLSHPPSSSSSSNVESKYQQQQQQPPQSLPILSQCDGSISATQALLSPLITRPKLTDKLLSKPPFRFLHDIIMELINTSTIGFAADLYSEDERDGVAMTDKQMKTLFLDKMIEYINSQLGVILEVRTAKILAGLDAESTNVFLQHMAIVANGSQNQQAITSTFNNNNNSDSNMNNHQLLSRDSESKINNSKNNNNANGIQSQQSSSRPSSNSSTSSRDTVPMANTSTATNTAATVAEAKSIHSQPHHTAIELKTQGIAAATTTMNDDKFINKLSLPQCDGSISTTQALLSPLITRPKLTEKLLSKPPFRFLHDIFMELINTSTIGFATNLYSEDEKDGVAMTDKHMKTVFLDKMIEYINSQLGVTLEVRTAKILAGLEAESTNVFLQHMAIAATGANNYINHNRIGNNHINTAESESKISNNNTTSNSSRPPSRSPRQQQSQLQSATITGTATSSSSSSTTTLNKPVIAEAKSSSSSPRVTAMDEEAPTAITSRSTRPMTAGRRPPKVMMAQSITTSSATATAEDSKSLPTKQQVVQGIFIDGQDNDDKGSGDDDLITGTRLADDTTTIGIRVESKLVKDILSRQVEQNQRQTLTTGRPESKDDDNDSNITENKSSSSTSGIRLMRRHAIDSKNNNNTNNKGQNSNIVSSSSTSTHATITSSYSTQQQNYLQHIVREVGPIGSCVELILSHDLTQMAHEMRTWEEQLIRNTALRRDTQNKSSEVLLPLELELRNLQHEIEIKKQALTHQKRTIFIQDEKINEAYKKAAVL